MIKVGDKVEAISGATYHGKAQNIVTSISNCYQYIRFDGQEGGWYINHFKVVDTSKWHKHHNLIIEWAKGAKIEARGDASSEWHKTKYPSWSEDTEYREWEPTEPTEPTELELLEEKYKELGNTIKKLKG